MNRGWLVVGSLALSAAACAPATHYVRVGEALTAPTLAETIRVERQFTDAERVQACRRPVRIARLEVAPSRLELVSGTRYELNSLSVVAVDEAGRAVDRVPVILEAEEATPSRVRLRSDDPDLAGGRLVAQEPGAFHLRIRTMCPIGPTAERVVDGRVTR